MASTYTQQKEEDLQKKLQTSAAETKAQQSGTNLQQIASQAANLYGYTPSAQLQQAQQKVTNLQQQKPAEFNSAYTQKLQDQFEAIMNRQPFNYDLGTDPLWNQYSDMYVQKGRRAMQDTMGQAAALTGGYGNSYAQGAGQAAYGNYLQDLNALAPEFQNQAFTRYQQEGADMLDRYNTMQNRENIEYGRYTDALNNYWSELDRAQQNAYDMYDREINAYNNQREYAYNTALTILQGGKMPSDDLLAAAGLSAADAQTLMNLYKTRSSGSKSSEDKSSKDESQNKKKTSTQEKTGTTAPYRVMSSADKLALDESFGKVKLTNTDVDDGIMTYRDWSNNKSDPVARATKENETTFQIRNTLTNGAADIEQYRDYVADKIVADTLSGFIDKKKAAELTIKYLVNADDESLLKSVLK